MILDFVKPYIKIMPQPYKRFGERQGSQASGTEAAEPIPETEEQLAVQKINTISEFILFTVTG